MDLKSDHDPREPNPMVQHASCPRKSALTLPRWFPRLLDFGASNLFRASGFGFRVSLVLAVLAGVVLFCFDPSRSAFYPVCLFHKTTGLLCPGCGSLRALHELLHGHLATAWRFNPLLVGSLPVLFWFGAQYARCSLKPSPARAFHIRAPGWSVAQIANLRYPAEGAVSGTDYQPPPCPKQEQSGRALLAVRPFWLWLWLAAGLAFAVCRNLAFFGFGPSLQG
jgi:hypothetical protein